MVGIPPIAEGHHSQIVPVAHGLNQVEELRSILELISRPVWAADAGRLFAKGRRGPSCGSATRRTSRPGSPQDQRLVILLAERDPNTTRFADHVLRNRRSSPHRLDRLPPTPVSTLVPAIGPALLNDGESTMT